MVHLYNELRKLMPTIMQLTYAPRGEAASGIPSARSQQARLKGLQGQEQAQQPAGLVQLAEDVTHARFRDMPQLASFVAARQQAMAAWGGAGSLTTAQSFPLVSTCWQGSPLASSQLRWGQLHAVADQLTTWLGHLAAQQSVCFVAGPPPGRYQASTHLLGPVSPTLRQQACGASADRL